MVLRAFSRSASHLLFVFCFFFILVRREAAVTIVLHLQEIRLLQSIFFSFFFCLIIGLTMGDRITVECLKLLSLAQIILLMEAY